MTDPRHRPHTGFRRRPGPARMVAIAAVLATMAVAGRSHADVIERVVAVVNDDAIFLSELRRRAVPYLAAAYEAPTEAQRIDYLRQIYERLLDELVTERLVEQAASRLQLRVTRADVDQAIENVAQANGLALADFWVAVREQGFTEAQYRRDVRSQLLRLKVINQQARDRVNITEQDVRRRYERELRQANRALRFRLAEIFFPVEEGASATEVAAVRAEAEAFLDGLTAENFVDRGGLELGELAQGDLPPDLEEAVLAVAPGTIAGPVRGPNGFHLLLLQERERGGAGLPTFDQVKDDLYRQMLEEAIGRQTDQILAELRREAVIDTRL